MARVTFSLDEETVARIRRTAARLRKPQSHVVREAVAEFVARADRLHALAVLARLREQKVTRPPADVDRELRALRSVRRAGGRRASSR